MFTSQKYLIQIIHYYDFLILNVNNALSEVASTLTIILIWDRKFTITIDKFEFVMNEKEVNNDKAHFCGQFNNL